MLEYELQELLILSNNTYNFIPLYRRRAPLTYAPINGVLGRSI